MPRLTRILSTLALALTALADPSLAAPCEPGHVEVRGRIMDPDLAATDGVACCEVFIEIRGMGTVTTRTRADGTFSACVPCTTPDLLTVFVAASCCRVADTRDIDGCIDPATGSERIVDFGELRCLNPPFTNMTALMGTVTCRAGVLVEPVVGCPVTSESDANAGFARTDAFGDWEMCVPCGVMRPWDVRTQCCDNLQRAGIDCPERRIMETVVCDPCPVPPCPLDDEIEVTGSVLCLLDEDGDTLPDPMIGCPVRLSAVSACSTPSPDRVVTTAPDGSWSSCFTCPATPDCPRWTLTSIAECCGSVISQDMLGCPPHPFPIAHVCRPALGGTCAGVLPCPAGETIVRGRITCPDPVTGDPRPVAGCIVQLAPFNCGRPPVTVITDADGYYTGCVPCAGCNEIDVIAECCGASRRAPFNCANESIVDLTCGSCAPGANPCTPEREIAGVVTCLDFSTGLPVPIPACRVRIECAFGGGSIVYADTDPAGYYEACFPCSDCDDLRVTAECCGPAGRNIFAPACDSYRVDLACGDCAPPRPCPGRDAMQASGTVHCEHGGNLTALAGCPVELRGLDAAGNVMTTGTATSDGAGAYVGCVGCGAGAVTRVEAVATCCGASSSQDVTSCPETLAMPGIECTGCSPCPDGYTRLQGRVRCRGGGPVAGCEVQIHVPTCGGDLVLNATTDAQGNYRLCVPCPCPDEPIRVTALCCSSTRVVPPGACGPITPVPTLFCEVPCR